MIDIVLINPNERKKIYDKLSLISAIEPPTFTLLVAQYLRQKGLSVEIIDQGPFDKSPESIAYEVENLDPVLVGVYVYGYQPSASTQNMSAARRICQAIKNFNPHRKIMMSGTHMAALPQRTLFEEPVDFVCDREGFVTPWQLALNLKYHASCSQGMQYIDKVPDLWYKDWKFDKSLYAENDLNERVAESGVLSSHFTHRGQLLTPEQFDQIGAPAWDLVEHNGKLNHYRSHNWHSFNTGVTSPYASMYTSFGCPYKCNFCCINAPFGDMMKGPRPYRLVSPETAVNQVRVLVDKYGIKQIKFVDEMFVLNPKHVLGICDGLIREGLNKEINIWAYCRVDTAQEKFLVPLKNAGFNWLGIGIESASQFVRDGADKAFSNEKIVEIIRKIQAHDIYVAANYIFGLPDDTEESMKYTYDLSVFLNSEWANFYSAMAYPGSPLYSTSKPEELPPSWDAYSQHSFDTFPLRNENLTNAQILAFRDWAHMNYFSRVEYRNLLDSKFGSQAVKDVDDMLNLGYPKRKIYG